MVYKYKVRMRHLLDDLDHGLIKSKEEYKKVLDTVDLDTFIEYFLEEYPDQTDESSAEDASKEPEPQDDF